MTFHTALSGLHAAQADLNVTAHNIANANTTGFKRSRAEFGDLFPMTAYGIASNAIGSGVKLERVAQQFEQGSINQTNNALDLAIAGEGFFTVSDNGALAYTRAGAFTPNRDGFVENAMGQRLQVFPPVEGSPGQFNTAQLSDLRVQIGENSPRASTTITALTNLPASAAPPTTTPFDATDPTSYNFTRSLTVFDSLGASHNANLFFVKDSALNTWTVHTQVDGADVGTGTPVTYGPDGQMTSPANGQIALPLVPLSTGAADLNLTIDMARSTQFGDAFTLTSLSQDGFATGRLTDIEVTAEGIVQARYTNGQSTPLGQLAMANFPSPQNLRQLGDTTWAESFAAGQVQRGTAGSPEFGSIESGALEASNVDLTDQLVNMIIAQRYFQANAQMITTQDQITQTVINMR